jgi:hypothetical protein
MGASSKVEKETFPLVGENGKTDSRPMLNGVERDANKLLRGRINVRYKVLSINTENTTKSIQNKSRKHLINVRYKVREITLRVGQGFL